MTSEAHRERVSSVSRLSSKTLAGVPETVSRPRYAPGEHGVGIVHIGVGAFHRAHQAVYTDSALGLHGGDWRIAGVALRSAKAADQLNPQDGLYTVATKGPGIDEYRIVGSISGVHESVSDSRSAIGDMSADTTRIVSLTVTEKGYCRDSATGDLNMTSPGVRTDLEHAASPRTAIGCITEALRQRMNRGLAPFTVLSCDNLPANGEATRKVVVQFAELVDVELAGWIRRNVSFPSTMVDRICPATTAEDLQAAYRAMNVRDDGLVVAESFTQWVIQDQFAAGRPRWEDAGAEMVGDVTPFEIAKLRMLNGSHSTLAYLGCLMGDEYIHQALARPAAESFLRILMLEEIIPTLNAESDEQKASYLETLIDRFRNESLAHRSAQVAMDGSQKIPQRLLAAAEERMAAGGSIDAISFAVALWLRFVSGNDCTGNRREVDDPLQAQLLQLPSSETYSAEQVAAGALELVDVFGSTLGASSRFRSSLADALQAIQREGAEGAMKSFVAGRRGEKTRDA